MIAPERLKAFLTAEDEFVRDAVARHFGQSYSRDPDLIGLVLDACERYGDEQNLGGLSHCNDFVVTESVFDRVLLHLSRATDKRAAGHLNYAILDAPVELISSRAESIRANPNFDLDLAVRLERRVDFAAWTSERLWQELQDHAKRAEKEWDRDGFDTAYSDDLVDALIGRDIPDTATICAMLRNRGRSEWNGWLEIWLVDLAGKRRLREAVPLIVDKLQVDSDFLLEAAQRALPRIGDPEAARLIRAAYPTAVDHFRIHAAHVLANIPYPDSEDALLALVEIERDRCLRTILCMALCELFSERGVPIVLREIDRGYDRMTTRLEFDVLPVADVLAVTLPLDKRWRDQRDREEKRVAKRIAEMEEWGKHQPAVATPVPAGVGYLPPVQTPTVRADRVGRNDPCPCGSGKKYKKCCGRNK
jgi:hypothetical protein